MIFIAVQRCPLKERDPNKHSLIAESKSALSVTIAAFLASKPKMARKRFTFGCIFFNLSATLEDPISVNTSIFPDSIN